MPDSSSDNPPRGDFETAERYINQLVDLLNNGKIEVYHTDLKRFDPTTLQDHYTVSLKEYQIELSHSKQPESGKDSYVMIFNNMKQISEGSPAKVILAYIYLVDAQFSKFKVVADHFIDQRRKAEEERRFKEALQPIDQLLGEASHFSVDTEQVSQNDQGFNSAEMQNFKQDFQQSLDSSLGIDHSNNDLNFSESSKIAQG